MLKSCIFLLLSVCCDLLTLSSFNSVKQVCSVEQVLLCCVLCIAFNLCHFCQVKVHPGFVNSAHANLRTFSSDHFYLWGSMCTTFKYKWFSISTFSLILPWLFWLPVTNPTCILTFKTTKLFATHSAYTYCIYYEDYQHRNSKQSCLDILLQTRDFKMLRMTTLPDINTLWSQSFSRTTS